MCCGKVEDFSHILTECESPGRSIIWDLAGELWEKKQNIPWNTPTLGLILGCGLARIAPAGDKRLWKIIIAESAYLIWFLRCKRVIENEGRPFAEAEIRNKWVKRMNERLRLDCRMTDKKFEKRALSKKLVHQTWEGTLKDDIWKMLWLYAALRDST